MLSDLAKINNFKVRQIASDIKFFDLIVGNLLESMTQKNFQGIRHVVQNRVKTDPKVLEGCPKEGGLIKL